jgi:hypothetical protein
MTGRCSAGECTEQLLSSDERIPRDYHVEMATRDAAASARQAGILIFAVSYGAAYGAALARPRDLSWLYAPVVGPFVAMRDRTTAEKVLLGIDGGLQIAGAVLLVGGITLAGKQLVRNPPPRVQLVPHVESNGAGASMVGAF